MLLTAAFGEWGINPPDIVALEPNVACFSTTILLRWRASNVDIALDADIDLLRSSDEQLIYMLVEMCAIDARVPIAEPL